jgi:cellulose synthase/poly-beta-1,6-N-acetylglucosamine synthase-like glycosyltransferase
MLHLSDLAILASYYAVLLALAVYGFHRMMMVYLYYRNRERRPAAGAPLDPLPAVTVQLPVFNERYVVERLIAAVAALDYPRALLEIQVLDDSTDETASIARRAVDRERARGIDIHYIHRGHRAGFKAGALQAGMERARGEFMFIFDADFVPPPGFIRETLDFFGDPEVGMVQARWDHLNRNFSLLTRLQSILLDGHFVVEHTARNRSHRFFNFNGTAGAWRRATIEEAGGWKSDTLTEDIDLSYRAQLARWKFVYLKDVVSPAEVPVDINGFKTQQHRWAKGAIQTGRKLLPRIFRSAFPLRVKIESFFHLTNNFSYPLVIALSILVFPAMVIRHRLGWTRLILLDFPLFFISTFSVVLFYAVSQKEIDARWIRQLRYMPMVMSLGIGLAVNNAHAVLEALIGKGGEFRRTPKYSIGEEAEEWRGKAYRTGVNPSFPFEVALAAYFALTIALSLMERIYLAIPFLLIFFSGYFYMSMLTVAQQLPRRLAPAGLAAVRARGKASSGAMPLPPSAEA